MNDNYVSKILSDCFTSVIIHMEPYSYRIECNNQYKLGLIHNVNSRGTYNNFPNILPFVIIDCIYNDISVLCLNKIDQI